MRRTNWKSSRQELLRNTERKSRRIDTLFGLEFTKLTNGKKRTLFSILWQINTIQTNTFSDSFICSDIWPLVLSGIKLTFHHQGTYTCCVNRTLYAMATRARKEWLLYITIFDSCLEWIHVVFKLVNIYKRKKITKRKERKKQWTVWTFLAKKQ